MKFVSIKALKKSFYNETILYSNSVLQYFKDDLIFEEMVSQIAPDHVVIDDLLVNPLGEMFTLQNYYGFMIVNRFLNEVKFVGKMKSLGYSISSCTDYFSNISTQVNQAIWIGDEDVIKGPNHKSMIFSRTIASN